MRRIGLEDTWSAVDAGKFVRFVPAHHAEYLQIYKLLDGVISTITVVCTLGTFKDGLRYMFGEEKESTPRARLKRWQEAGHIHVTGTGGGKIPLVLIRGTDCVPMGAMRRKCRAFWAQQAQLNGLSIFLDQAKF
jgi:hypothetical protein